MIADRVGRQRTGPGAVDVGEEQAGRYHCRSTVTISPWESGIKRGLLAASGKVRDLLRQASLTRHKMDMSLDAERDPFAIRRPGGNLIIPIGREGRSVVMRAGQLPFPPWDDITEAGIHPREIRRP